MSSSSSNNNISARIMPRGWEARKDKVRMLLPRLTHKRLCTYPLCANSNLGENVHTHAVRSSLAPNSQPHTRVTRKLIT
jgi:hypothetical protein